jgi:hypothetical protein
MTNTTAEGKAGPVQDETGRRYGGIVVLRRASAKRAAEKGPGEWWVCKYDCGKLAVFSGAFLAARREREEEEARKAAEPKPEVHKMTKTEAGKLGGIARAKMNLAEHPALLKKVEVAALLKAQGKTWKEIGKALGYSSGDSAAKTLRDNRGGELWMEAYLAALDNVLRQDVEPETVEALREIIAKCKHSRDSRMVKNAQAAGHTLLMHCGRLRTARLELITKKQVQADSQLIEELKGGVNETTRRILESMTMPKLPPLPVSEEELPSEEESPDVPTTEPENA